MLREFHYLNLILFPRDTCDEIFISFFPSNELYWHSSCARNSTGCTKLRFRKPRFTSYSPLIAATIIRIRPLEQEYPRKLRSTTESYVSRTCTPSNFDCPVTVCSLTGRLTKEKEVQKWRSNKMESSYDERYASLFVSRKWSGAYVSSKRTFLRISGPWWI